MVYQVKSGRKVLGSYKTKKEAGRKLARSLYDSNNLSLVKVVSPKKKPKTTRNRSVDKWYTYNPK